MSGSCLSKNPDPEFRKFLRTRNKICPTRDAKTPIIFAQDWYKIGNWNHQTCVLSKSKLLSSRLLFSRQLLNSRLYKFLYKKKYNLVIWNYHNSLSNFVFWVVMKTNKEQTNKQKRDENESHTSHDSLSSIPLEAMIVPGSSPKGLRARVVFQVATHSCLSLCTCPIVLSKGTLLKGRLSNGRLLKGSFLTDYYLYLYFLLVLCLFHLSALPHPSWDLVLLRSQFLVYRWVRA